MSSSKPDLDPLRPPHGLASAGRDLWVAILGNYDLEAHELAVLLQACRCADHLDRLAEDAAGQPVMTTNFKGDLVCRPSITESRQQAITLSRLLASLRIPNGEEGSRPQLRSVRGAYRPRAL